MLLRCPACGRAGVLRSWISLRECCSICVLRFDRGEEGYFLGAVFVNVIAAELSFVAGLAVVIFLTWPRPPWDAMFWGGIGLMILLPILFFPFSKTLWLAFDLMFRPSVPGDRDLRSGS